MLARDPRFLAGSVAVDDGAGRFRTVSPRGMLASDELTMPATMVRPGFWYSVPEKNEYGALDRDYQQLAKERGMTTA